MPLNPCISGNGCFRRASHNKRTLGNLVQEYVLYCRPLARHELQFFTSQPTFTETIEVSALCQDSAGKRFSHQRRRSQATLIEARDILVSRSRQLQRCRSFQELHDAVNSLVVHVRDLGPLYSYDTAVHIGAKLGLMPDEVYLHSGTRKGARALGLPYRQPTLQISSLPIALHQLAGYEIEDFLCIFKNEFDEAMA